VTIPAPVPDSAANLEANLKFLEQQVDFICGEARAQVLSQGEHRYQLLKFYRMLAYEAAGKINPTDFRLCVGIARQQMRGK
jgi:hypothetical protein